MKGKWVQKRLDQIGEIVPGGTPSTSNEAYWGGGIPFITPMDLRNVHFSWIKDTERFVSEYGVKKSAANLIPEKSIVISTRAPIGYLGITRCPSVTNQGCKSIVLKKNENHSFHYYNLSLYIDIMKRYGVGTTFAEISKNDLSRIEITYPENIDDQQHIADILTSCDEVIEQTEKAIEKYRAIKAGMLQDLFTRGVDANGRLRPKPEDAPELYKDSPLGKIPKEWEILPFAQCFELRKNNTISRAFLSDQQGEIYNIHYGDVLIKFQSCVDCRKDEIPSILTEKVSSFSEDYAKEGDVIFADTAEDDTVGKAVELINVGTMKLVSGLHTIFCHPIGNRFASRWLGYFVNSDVFHEQLLPYVAGSKVSSISRENIRKTYILRPRVGEQQFAVDKLVSQDRTISFEEEALVKYRSIKLGLMKKLLTPPEGALEA